MKEKSQKKRKKTKMSYKIVTKYIKDLSFEIHSTKSYFLLEKNIKNYTFVCDIKSKEINDSFTFRKTFMISALRGYGVSDMRSWMLANMPQKSWTYPKSKRHDMTMEKFLNEKTREAILLRIHQEVPYNLEVDTYEIETLRDGNIKVWQSINVQNARHRAMLIGKSGHTIKAISSGSRVKIEKALNKKVHLFLDVKLKKRKPARMQSLEGLL